MVRGEAGWEKLKGAWTDAAWGRILCCSDKHGSEAEEKDGKGGGSSGSRNHHFVLGFKLRIHICTGHEVNGEEKTEDAVKEVGGCYRQGTNMGRKEGCSSLRAHRGHTEKTGKD